MTRLNLLPFRIRRNDLLWLRARQWIVAWLLGASVCASYCMSVWREERAARRSAERMSEAFVPVAEARAEMRRYRQQIAEAQQEIGVGLALANERPALSLLGAVSQSVAVANGVTVGRFTFTTQPVSGADARLVLTGVGIDNVAVARLAAQLRDFQLFHKVDVNSAGSVDLGDVQATSYTIECSNIQGTGG